MLVTVISPEKEIYEGEVSAVHVPGTSGRFEVLNNHAALVSSLASGMVTLIPTTGSNVEFRIEKGFIEVLNNKVSLLVQGVKES